MSDLPSMPLFVDDYEAATAHLTMEEDGAYNRLLRLCWRTPGCSLPDDDAWIMRRMRCDEETFERVVSVVLAEFFTRKSGRVYQKRQQEVYGDVNERISKRKQAGSKGGRAKSLKNNETEFSKATDLLEANGKQKGAVALASKTKTKEEKNTKKRKCPLPDDCPTIEAQEKALAYWREHSTPATLQVQIDKFRAHHQANGTTFVDWGAAWRTWYTNAKDFAEREGRKGQPKGQASEHWAQAAPQAQAQPEGPTPLDWYKAAEHFVNFGEWPAEVADKLGQCPPEMWAKATGKAA